MSGEVSYLELTGNKRSTKSFQDFLQQWNSNSTWINKLFDRIIVLEARVKELEKPQRKKRIIELLKREGIPRSDRWLFRRGDFEWIDLRELVEEGKLQKMQSGPAHTMYSIIDIKKRGR